MDPAAVTWTPEIKGVGVEVTPGRGDSELLVKIDVATEAADALYREKGAALIFRHPGIGAARVRLCRAVRQWVAGRSFPG